MKTYNFFPNAYETSRVEGVEGKFSYDVVTKAGLPHYDHNGNLSFPIEITENKLNELVKLMKEEKAYRRRFADIKEPLQIVGWSSFEDEYFGDGKKLQIDVIIAGKEVSFYSNKLDHTILRAIYNIMYVDLSLSVKTEMNYDDKSAINQSIEWFDNFGNNNLFRNEGFIKTIIAYIQENEAAICKEFGYKTNAEREEQIGKAEKEEIAYKNKFDAAKPNDLVDSGFGYVVKKKDFNKAQKMGYDGIENM